MGWIWYLTPFGWIDVYLWLLVFIHETGHALIGLLTFQKIILFQVGSGEPVIVRTFGSMRVELAGNSGAVISGKVRMCQVGPYARVPRAFLATLGGPGAVAAFSVALAMASLKIMPPADAAWTGSIAPMALNFLALVGFADAILDLPREITALYKNLRGK